MTTELMFFCTVAAAIPAAMIAVNLRHYRVLPESTHREVPSVSVLIPARNEAGNIRAAIESVLHCEGLDFEVLIWDDHSSDDTAEIVREISSKDSRVRLIKGVPLPSEWAGKPFGCWNLAERSRGDVLLFMDADVRLRGGDSLMRMAAAFRRTDLDLLSGVPWQRVETLSEVMMVPLIHFVLLGFLPFQKMRATSDPRFAAACGQLMLFRRSSYFEVGGHSSAKRSFHDGLALSRSFRKAKRVTDLFDATGVAVCRMYSGVGEVWRGFAKNAHEGLASPKTILPFSSLLLFGQVVPFLALVSNKLTGTAARLALCALVLNFAARGALGIRFKQPLSGVLLQPVAVGMLLLNQWYGALRYWIGKPVSWRGRSLAVLLFLSATSVQGLSLGAFKCPNFQLEDQSLVSHQVEFPRQRPLYIVAATRAGLSQVSPWVKPVVKQFGEKVEILGLADVRGIPSMFHGMVRAKIRDGTKWPVLMDWKASLIPALCSPEFTTEVLVIHPNGDVRVRIAGQASPETLERVKQELQSMILENGGKTPAVKK